MLPEPYYETDNGKLYCGDCLDIMREMDSDSIDLTLTSPPYGDLRKYKNPKYDFRGIANELFRIIKSNGTLVWIIGDHVIKGTESGLG